MDVRKAISVPVPRRGGGPVVRGWGTLLLIKALVFAIILMGSLRFGLPNSAVYLAFPLIYGPLALLTFSSSFQRIEGKSLGVLILGAVFAGSNILLSLDPRESALRWAAFFVMFAVCLKFAISMDARRFRDALSFLPLSFLVFVAIGGVIWVYGRESFKGGNMHGTYAGALLVSAPFLRRNSYAIALSCLGLTALMVSHSRGALIAVAIAFVPLGWYWLRRIGPAVLTAVLLIALVALLAEWKFDVLEEYMKAKTAKTGGDIGAELGATTQARLVMWTKGINLVRERPWGYGLGDAYFPHLAQGMLAEKETLSVHNGILTTVIELGVHGSLIVCGAIAAALFQLLRRFRNIDPGIRLPIAAMLIYCIFRSLTENYLIFNTGNTVTLSFIFLNLVLLLNRRVFQPLWRHAPGRAGPASRHSASYGTLKRRPKALGRQSSGI